MIQQLKAQRQSRSRPHSARTPRRSATTANNRGANQNLASSNHSLRTLATSTTDKQRRASSARSPLASSSSLGQSQLHSNKASTAPRAGAQPKDPRTHPFMMTATCGTTTSRTEKRQHQEQDGAVDEPAASPSKSSSFQKQVLDELQKLKQVRELPSWSNCYYTHCYYQPTCPTSLINSPVCCCCWCSLLQCRRS